MSKVSVRITVARLAFACLLGAGIATVGAQDVPAARKPDVRYQPTPSAVLTQMLNITKITKDDVVFDLGCGDGRVVIAASKQFGARGMGIDIDPKLIGIAQENARKAKVAGRVKFLTQDLFDADVHEATIVMLFLNPEVNLKLRPKLWKELKPGTRVVSHCHNMGDWKPEREIRVGKHTVYLWTVR